MDFNEIKEYLRKRGFTFFTDEPGLFRAENKKLVVAASINDDIYSTLQHRVAFESKNTFDKWSTVPFSFKLPVDKKRFVLSLKYATTKECQKRSNKFEIIVRE